ncbi:MAG: ribosome biogenesis GTP-binding protein YihA/YsxC [Polyangiaceae bacterium]
MTDKPSAKSAPIQGAGDPARKAAPSPHQIIDAKFVAGAGIEGGALPPATFVEVAFAGRSNTGKSSLINTLVERRSLVRTSSTPGCTRQVNLFEVTARDGLKLHLADLPGYGFAKRSKQERADWARLIEGYLRERATLRAVVILFDVRRGMEGDDEELVTFARAPRPGLGALEVVLVATKIDKLSRSERRARVAELDRKTGARVLGFSAVTGDGRDDLWRAIRRAAGVSAALGEARA